MRDEDDGELTLFLDAVYKLEYLRLYGNVERGRRLVADKDIGVSRKRYRYDYALTHTARELERILTETLARLGYTDLLHQFERVRLCRAARHFVSNARRFELEVVYHRDGARIEIDAVRLGDVALVTRFYALYKRAYARFCLVEVDEVLLRDFPIGRFAARRLLVVARLLLGVTFFFLGVSLNAVEVAVDSRFDARTECIGYIVLYRVEAVDGGLYRMIDSLARGVSLFLVKLAVEYADELIHRRYRVLLVVDRLPVGIHNSRLGAAYELEHELFVEIFTRECVKLRDGHLGNGLARKSQIVREREEIRLVEGYRFREYVLYLAERFRDFRIVGLVDGLCIAVEYRLDEVTHLYHRRDLGKSLEPVRLRGELACARVRHEPVNGFVRAVDYFFYFAEQSRRRVLLDMEQYIVDSGNRLARRFLSRDESVFEL